jgi:hypothetical protein
MMLNDKNTIEQPFAICLRNDGYSASLEVRKIYQILPDAEAAKHHQMRVIDESGEDYLYPDNYFASVNLPEIAKNVFFQPSVFSGDIGKPCHV